MGMCLACLSGEKDDYEQPSPVGIKATRFRDQIVVINRVICLVTITIVASRHHRQLSY